MGRPHTVTFVRHGAALAIGMIAMMTMGARAGAQRATALTIRNNHEIPYRGAMDFVADLADGDYRDSATGAAADVRGGRIHAFAALMPHSELTLQRSGNASGRAFSAGPLSAAPSGGTLALTFRTKGIADISLGLAVIPGSSATFNDAIRTFAPLDLAWTKAADGSFEAHTTNGDYDIVISARPYGAGTLDVRTWVVSRNSSPAPAYVALIRRVVSPGMRLLQHRFNGRVLPGANSPSTWEGDFRYVHGVDWLQWTSGGVMLLSVNGFSPVPSVKHDTTWAEGSFFYVRERTVQHADTAFLVSEIAGPNPDQPKKGYMAVLPYAPPSAGDTVALKWRLATAETPEISWQESQLRVFDGTRAAEKDGATIRASIGVPYTSFGMSYFPYSSFSENFDYYRVPGLTSENFWPTSPEMWKEWRKFIPRMKSDMRIIRAMGFDMLRLHHLELLQTLPRAEAFAFLDFYAGEARELGFKLLIDTEGPTDWITAVVGRYKDLVARVEIENEVLIPGITPAEPARWKAEYAAVKQASPTTQAFFTGAGNNSMFERLKALGVPFDRVGLHAYKHGPNWKEAWASHALGTAGYATELGKPMTIGEFNWKDLTRLSPDLRPNEWRTIYEDVLATHAVPEIFEFQFQEQIVFNTTVGGTSSRHYEPVGIDRRPKPEAFVAMDLMRKYGRPDAAVNVLPIDVKPVRFVNGRAEAEFIVTNNTGGDVTLAIEPTAFDGATTKLLTPGSVKVAKGAKVMGRVELTLAPKALPGAYHHFVNIRYNQDRAIGWGVASNEGAPTFADTTILGDRVRYAQGLAVVKTIDWNRSLAVVYDEKSTALELEQAYQLANTLQSATGKAVRISISRDLPDSLKKRGTVFYVGVTKADSAAGNTLPDQGVIAVDKTDGHEWVAFSGRTAKAVEAAVVEFELRYWPNAKDATIRITGVEKGAALGHRTGGTSADLP